MSRILLWNSVALVALASNAGSIFGATFTAPLQLSEGTAIEGSYQTAAFDFGVRFAEIESVRIEFLMSEGYDGFTMSTGNTTHTRYLFGVVHGRPDPTEADPPGADASPFVGLFTSKRNVAAGTVAEFSFEQTTFSEIGGDRMWVFPVWPDFLYSGRGHFSFVDVSTSYVHPIGQPGQGSSSASWMPLDGVESAVLTVVATPVPEPGSIALLVLSAATAARLCRRTK